jgi:hypothetical protein
VIRSIRQPEDRVARRGVRARALALAVAACAAAAVPAGAATGAYPPGPGAPAPGAPAPDLPAPHPDAPPVTTNPTTGAPAPAPAAPEPADAPRPVAQRPTAGGGSPANDASLAIRRLNVTARVSLTAERPARLTVTFVPRPGSLVAQVRLSVRNGAARRLVLSRTVRVRSGHRATVRLRVTGMTPGAYEVSVRAGAARATLGPAVVAKLDID